MHSVRAFLIPNILIRFRMIALINSGKQIPQPPNENLIRSSNSLSNNILIDKGRISEFRH